MNCRLAARLSGIVAILTLLVAACGNTPAARISGEQRSVSAKPDDIVIANVTLVDVVSGAKQAAMGREKTQGTIEVGQRADLMLLEADPLTDIRNTRRIAAVLVHGRLLSKPDIDRTLAAHRRGLPRQ